MHIKNIKKKTAIGCTIGPACLSKETIRAMVDGGMNFARLNFAHGTHESHKAAIKLLREVAEEAHVSLSIVMDMKGTDIRTGPFPNGRVQVTAGSPYIFYSNFMHGSDKGCSVTFWDLPRICKPGDKIYVDYGKVGFVVNSVQGKAVHTTVENTGFVGERKVVTLPGHSVDLPFLTYQDTWDIHFAIENGLDYISVSGIRSPHDILEVRSLPGVKESGIKLLAKVENKDIISAFDDVLEVSDGAIVCRSNVCVDTALEEVPQIQKQAILKCNLAGKPALVTNQVLQSMEMNPRPTRAEATDVANALFDGADGVILTNTTAVGPYPVEAVRMLSAICVETEPRLDYRLLYGQVRQHDFEKGNMISVAESVTSSAVKTLWDLNAGLLIVLTTQGTSALYATKYKPHTPILCITSCQKTAQQLALTRATTPVLVDSMKGSEELISQAIQKSLECGLLQKGDAVVVVYGSQEGVPGSTNQFRIISSI